jgi:uncharacterized protein
MSPDLQRLIKLQQLESTIADGRATIATHPQRLADADARLNESKQAVETAKSRLKDNQEARRNLEKDVAVYQGRLTKFKDQLSLVKTNKEYQAMQKEMSVAEQEISDLETRMLERMEEADSLAVELKTAQGALAAEQAETTRERQALENERGTVADDLKRLSEERAMTAALVSAEALALFERLAHNRRGLAMAEARDGLCTVCHVRLRPQVFNQARRNAGIVQCDSCTRILYFVPVAPAASPQQSS